MLLFAKMLKNAKYFVICSIIMTIVAGMSCTKLGGGDVGKTDFLTEEERAWLDEHPEITIAPDPGYAPIEFFDEKGNFTGFAAEFLNEIEKILNYKFQIVKINNWGELLHRIENREIDMCVACVESESRRKFMVFSDPWLELPNVVVARKNAYNERVSFDELRKTKGTFAITHNYAMSDYIKDHCPNSKIEPVKDVEEALLRVSMGNSDYAVTNLAASTYIIHKNKIINLAVAASLPKRDVLHIGIRRDYQILKGIMNKALAEIPPSKYKEWWKKWVKFDSGENKFDPAVVLSILICSMIILVGFVMWNYLLKKKISDSTKSLHYELAESKKAEEIVLLCNQQLEKRVAERTMDLRETMVKLREEVEEHKQLEVKLNIARRELEQVVEKEKELNSMKTGFVSMVSHEYKTPLSVIMSSVSILDVYFQTGDSVGFKRQCRRINESIDGMLKMLNDVLFLGKAENNCIGYEDEKIDITELTQTIISNAKHAAGEKRTVLFNAVVSAPEIMLKRELYTHVLQNLLTNALKYSPKESTVEVQLIEGDHMMKLEVIDYGIGIPQDEQEDLFKPFHRFSNVGNVSGTGLGMSIIKYCVETMGGEITVKSVENKGTTMSATFPIYYPDESLESLF
ncbi:MAG: transporter substrate-binding domain-containing protein [Candidatus Kapabacteria bacterium]|nr:transporter substrate-binding domain-containing protein [Candidatus Kapabacteria bacterium]